MLLVLRLVAAVALAEAGRQRHAAPDDFRRLSDETVNRVGGAVERWWQKGQMAQQARDSKMSQKIASLEAEISRQRNAPKGPPPELMAKLHKIKGTTRRVADNQQRMIRVVDKISRENQLSDHRIQKSMEGSKYMEQSILDKLKAVGQQLQQVKSFVSQPPPPPVQAPATETTLFKVMSAVKQNKNAVAHVGGSVDNLKNLISSKAKQTLRSVGSAMAGIKSTESTIQQQIRHTDHDVKNGQTRVTKDITEMRNSVSSSLSNLDRDLSGSLKEIKTEVGSSKHNQKIGQQVLKQAVSGLSKALASFRMRVDTAMAKIQASVDKPLPTTTTTTTKPGVSPQQIRRLTNEVGQTKLETVNGNRQLAGKLDRFQGRIDFKMQALKEAEASSLGEIKRTYAKVDKIKKAVAMSRSDIRAVTGTVNTLHAEVGGVRKQIMGTNANIAKVQQQLSMSEMQIKTITGEVAKLQQALSSSKDGTIRKVDATMALIRGSENRIKLELGHNFKDELGKTKQDFKMGQHMLGQAISTLSADLSDFESRMNTAMNKLSSDVNKPTPAPAPPPAPPPPPPPAKPALSREQAMQLTSAVKQSESKIQHMDSEVRILGNLVGNLQKELQSNHQQTLSKLSEMHQQEHVDHEQAKRDIMDTKDAVEEVGRESAQSPAAPLPAQAPPAPPVPPPPPPAPPNPQIIAASVNEKVQVGLDKMLSALKDSLPSWYGQPAYANQQQYGAQVWYPGYQYPQYQGYR